MIAVTGANGLLGSFIVRKLIEKNESFIAVKRKGSDVSLLHDLRERIQWRDADVLDPVSLDEAFNGVTEVIHAAAMVSFDPRKKNKLFEVNVQGTRNIVNACLGAGVTDLVFISSVAALGRLKGQTLLDEEHKWVDNPLNSSYAKSKYLAELEVFRGHEEGLRTVVLNPSVILAPADWNKSSAKLFRYVWREMPFYIDNHLNWVDVRDVAEATHKLLRSDLRGDRFIVNAGQIPLASFLRETAVRFGKKAPKVQLNHTLLKLVAFAERLRSSLLGGEPLITAETARLAGTQFLYKNHKISKALNFQFQTIDKTLDWCCQYYIEAQKTKK